LYWFSQTIGPGRGLEEAIATLGNMQIPAELSLRGFISPAYRRELESLAQHYRLAHPLVFLPPGNPDDMPRLSKGYHLGLSLERRTPDNRNICLTNKIFAYLLAGIPVWLSETDAQRRLAGVLGEAALVAEPSDSQETARKLDAWLGNPEALRTSAEKAMELGRIKFNWDIEQRIFLKLVHSQLFFRNASPP
jgi:glycosyltransferase involved in cell wall biosynthesis